MLTYNLDAKNKYYSLYCHIRDDILCGNLQGGQKLPSKRALASNLSVSVITVQTAYDQLLAEGYIYSKERSGYFIADVTARAAVAPPQSGQAGGTASSSTRASASSGVRAAPPW